MVLTWCSYQGVVQFVACLLIVNDMGVRAARGFYLHCLHFFDNAGRSDYGFVLERSALVRTYNCLYLPTAALYDARRIAL